ncbi:MAG: Tetraacyldisaccharide 4'-kinase [Betaproteobacteria bacterium ADurb.Bin341]|nr:MAG: Tetraacyldisaccharide 4'-kinase [Betaproteobacteria bacterium ADurb.Bin341]
MSLAARLHRAWYARRPPLALWLLLPLHTLFFFLSWCRRLAYRCGVWRVVRLPIPVVVVGNLVVGGTGKTPLVLWLAEQLRQRGWRPGILSRGYGGSGIGVRAVLPDAAAAEVGDEPLLLARRSGLPVWVGADRVEAGKALLAAHPEVDVLIADDGLQHYRLARDAEIAVVDGRGAGNGWRLPLGPLREPLSRLNTVSALVFNGTVDAGVGAACPAPQFTMRLVSGDCYQLDDAALTCPASALAGKKLHAVAGIGDPGRFFDTLKSLGLEFQPHPFPDHHGYTASDLDFGDESVLLMTEKDAVKCAGLTRAEAWVLPVSAQVPPALADLVVETLNGRQTA